MTRRFEGGRQSQISGYYDPIPTAGLADAAGCTSWPTTSTAPDRWCCTAPQPRDVHRPRQLAGLVVGERRLEQAADAAVAGQGRRDEHPPDRRQDGAVLLQRQHRQHGGAGRRRPDRAGCRAGDHRRVRRRLAGSAPRTCRRRRTTGWRSRTAATSRRDPRSTSCACSSASGTRCRARSAPYRVIQFAVNPFKP